MLENNARRNPNELREELPLLRARVREIGERLERLNRRIAEIQRRSDMPFPVAVIDAEKCLGCGLCETACHFGAIAVDETALVNPSRCTGCGICAAECPQGAITLAPRTKLSGKGKNE